MCRSPYVVGQIPTISCPASRRGSPLTDYESQFRADPAACGTPNPVIAEFLRRLPSKAAVLGCGQGRDALVAARAGHSVTAIDLSPTGIQQMLAIAEGEGLEVEGLVADLADFEPSRHYDVVLLDRILHMFRDRSVRLQLLTSAAESTAGGGVLVVVDTPSHRQEIADFFDSAEWSVTRHGPDIAFAVRSG